MPDEPPTLPPAPTVPPGLLSARIGLLSATTGLCRHAETLPEGPARDTIRHAIQDTLNATSRLYPPAVVEAAQRYALVTLELPPPGAGERVPISGVSLELYAFELGRFLFAEGEGLETP